METNTTPKQTFSYPDQMRGQIEQVASTIKLLLEIPKSISTLRRIFRGEALIQNEDGTSQWIQVVKPVFLKLNPITREPLRKKIMLNNEEIETFVANDEAIEEVLSQLYFMGMNQVTSLTNLSEDNILDDLKEFECKLAGVLALKQVDWGLDKAIMPMTQTKIKTLVQDARYMCVEGRTMKHLSEQVQRIEQVVEGDKNLLKKMQSPYQ